MTALRRLSTLLAGAMNPARLLPLVLALLSAGCQELRVEPFHGS